LAVCSRLCSHSPTDACPARLRRGAYLLLATIGFVAIYVVPNLKYPANPPSVGIPATIGIRTALYFSMIAISIAAMACSVSLKRLLLP
jgi:hypothetical protein